MLLFFILVSMLVDPVDLENRNNFFTSSCVCLNVVQVQVEMQEDDLAGQAPDSRLTHPAPVALVAEWTGDTGYNQNRF